MAPDERQTSAPSSLGSSALKGGQILALGTVIERVARLGRNMLLARIIAPDQFGIMAITLASIGLFESITEVGVKQAVIQNKRGDTPEFLNVAWWFGVARGLIVAVLALALAQPIAGFYKMPELTPLLMVAPLTVMFSSLISPRVYALQREFRFRPTLWTFQGAGLLGTAFTILLGILFQNVWALLLGVIFEAFARFVLSFIVCPFRPRFHLDRESRKDLFRFSRGMAGLSLLTMLMLQGDTFVLGRVVTPEALGLYTMAIALAAFPLGIFSNVVYPLLVPIFARFQDDLGELCSSVLQLSRLVWLFGLPMACVIAIISESLLVLVYGRPQFAEAASALAIYGVFTVVYMGSLVTFSVYLGIAKPELQRRFTLVRAALVLVGLYPLSFLLGGTGAALALLIAMVGAMAAQLFNLRRVIGLRISAYLRTLWPGVLASVVVAVPCIGVVMLPDVPGWAQVVLAGAMGALVWGYLFLQERRALRTLRNPGQDGAG